MTNFKAVKFLRECTKVQTASFKITSRAKIMITYKARNLKASNKEATIVFKQDKP